MARDFTSGNTEYFVVETAALNSVPASIVAWFRKDVSGGSLNICNVVDSGDNDNRISLSITNSSPYYLEARHDNHPDSVAKTTTAPSQNTWHHGAAIFIDQTDREVYLDGGSKGTKSAIELQSPNWNRTQIGRFGDSTPNWEFDGQIAEVAVYSIALSQAEVSMLATGISPLKVRPESLVFYAPLNFKSGDEIDVVGGLVLTDTNTVAATDLAPPLIKHSAQIIQFPPPGAAPPASNPKGVLGGLVLGGPFGGPIG